MLNPHMWVLYSIWRDDTNMIRRNIFDFHWLKIKGNGNI